MARKRFKPLSGVIKLVILKVAARQGNVNTQALRSTSVSQDTSVKGRLTPVKGGLHVVKPGAIDIQKAGGPRHILGYALYREKALREIQPCASSRTSLEPVVLGHIKTIGVKRWLADNFLRGIGIGFNREVTYTYIKAQTLDI